MAWFGGSSDFDGRRRGGRSDCVAREELIQLSVKSSVVNPPDKPTLVCSVWTKKSYNLDSFRTQTRSIWKTKKKFDIQVVGQNLFLISFEVEEDLDSVMKGRSWLFRKQLILFNQLSEPAKRRKIHLATSSFWLKIEPCPPKCDRKDLMHAIRSTFEGIIRSEIKNDFCQIKVWLDVKKPFVKEYF